MNSRKIDPTDWLLGSNLNQGIEVTNASRTLYLSGQTSNGEDGSPLHEGDLLAQFQCAWNNLKQTLSDADMDASNIVRLKFYTSDVPAFMEAAEKLSRSTRVMGVSPPVLC